MTPAARLGQLRADVAQVMKRSSLRANVLRLIDAARADLSEPPAPAPPAPPAPMASPLYGLVIYARAAVGASPVVRDIEAEGIAQAWAEELARSDNFRHNPRLAELLSDPWYSAGENIAWGYTSEAEVHRAWMDSEGHRHNIEGRAFTALGVGRAANAAGRLFWVEVFVDRTPPAPMTFAGTGGGVWP